MTGSRVIALIRKVYRKIAKRRLATLLILISLATIMGVLLQPHVRSLIFGRWTRPQDLRMFLQQITTDQGINTKGFWEFREKYAPGNFSFSSGVEHLGTQVIQELPESGTPLHTFTSEYLISRDFVVPINAQINRAEQARQFLSERVSLPAQENILYADETNLLFKTVEGQHIIFFYRPIEELYQVDGLFDFTDAERALLRDTFWVNITEIK